MHAYFRSFRKVIRRRVGSLIARLVWWLSFAGCHERIGMRSRWWPIWSRPCQGCARVLGILVFLLFRLLAGRAASHPLVNCGLPRPAVCAESRGCTVNRGHARRVCSPHVVHSATMLHRLARNCTGPRASTGSSDLFIVIAGIHTIVPTQYCTIAFVSPFFRSLATFALPHSEA